MNYKELYDVSMEKMVKIALHLPEYEGLELIIVGGAITTKERYYSFGESLCHVFDDLKIKRYGKVIGQFSDVEVLSVSDEE